MILWKRKYILFPKADVIFFAPVTSKKIVSQDTTSPYQWNKANYSGFQQYEKR
jgi:hypothetical protein